MVGDMRSSPKIFCAQAYGADTQRRTFFTVEEATCDILVAAGVLEDDNSKIIVSMDGSRVYHDKENPRAEVTITTEKER